MQTTAGEAAIAVSVFIIAHDEADRIGRAIDSVAGFADEVVVIDSGSTDGTQEIARAHGARVVENAWPGYGPQKRFGEDQCRNDWIFNLDADEAATPALAAEIAGLARSGALARSPFWEVAIRDVFAHETAPAPWAYGYIQIRLYDRRVGRFSDSTVHDTVRPPKGARPARLRQPMEHRSIRSIAFQVEKMNRYSTAQVGDMAARGRRFARWRLVTEFPLAFLKAYVIRRYALYGWWGIVISVNFAYTRFLRVSKAYERELCEAAATPDRR
ncbi:MULTISPECIES: glycosyltransferase family 2 protein [unclassified Stappia]|uniref:glycosyltransferase family 2 protein n=1 Tax=unclassified Stappia TaxID=2629676 RepID=UPI001643B134|nr:MULTISPECIES: glycosyltransferase family 2 protein [unclassified Stappia]